MKLRGRKKEWETKGKRKVDQERNRDPIKGGRSRGGGDELQGGDDDDDELRFRASNDNEL